VIALALLKHCVLTVCSTKHRSSTDYLPSVRSTDSSGIHTSETMERILFVAALLSSVAGFHLPVNAPLFQYASKATAMPTSAEAAEVHAAAVPIWIPEPANIIARDLCKEYKATYLFKKSKRALHDVNVSFTCSDPVALVSPSVYTISLVPGVAFARHRAAF
jgi:hypothetical protein